MNEKLLQVLVVVVMKAISPDQVRDFAGHVLGYVRQKVVGSGSKIDDAVLIPVIDLLEAAFGISEK
jgi:hypothetical protein